MVLLVGKPTRFRKCSHAGRYADNKTRPSEENELRQRGQDTGTRRKLGGRQKQRGEERLLREELKRKAAKFFRVFEQAPLKKKLCKNRGDFSLLHNHFTKQS